MSIRSNRIYILGLPIDVVNDEDLPEAIDAIYSRPGNNQILLFNFKDFMRASFSRHYRRIVLNSALVLPVAKQIVWAARFLRFETPNLIYSYPFIIRLLGILEEKQRSVYLLCSDYNGIRKVESTIRTTFPGLHIVGRYEGCFKASHESDIIQAIRKASPTLLLTGKNLKRRQFWLNDKKSQLSPGMSIWEKSFADVFSGRKRKPNYSSGHRLMRNFFILLISPWRILGVFQYIALFFMLLVQRIRS